MNSKEPSEEVKTLELCTNFAKQQVNDLERKLKQSDMFITYEVERLQKELAEFKKCVKNFKRHLVEAILLMTASIVFIYALFLFYK
jgi:virulence-associated protein VapD